LDAPRPTHCAPSQATADRPASICPCW